MHRTSGYRMKKKIKINIKDVLPITHSREITQEGYLKCQIAVTRVGVYDYTAAELFDVEEEKTIKVFRPAEVVFHPKSKESLKLKPIVYDHEFVDIENYKDISVGTTGEDIYQADTERLACNALVTDPNVINLILESKIDKVSAGYGMDFIEQAGVYNGEPYQYMLIDWLDFNHIAIVPPHKEPRGGDTIKILDAILKKKGFKMPNIFKKKNGKETPPKSKEKLKIDVSDIDMGALAAKIAESEDFQNKLVSSIVAGIGVDGDVEPTEEEDPLMDVDPEEEPEKDPSMDVDPEEDPEEEKKKDPSRDAAGKKPGKDSVSKKAFGLKAAFRKVHDNAMKSFEQKTEVLTFAKDCLDSNEFEAVKGKQAKDILRASLEKFQGKNALKDASFEYMKGVMDSVKKSRAAAKNVFATTSADAEGTPGGYNFLQIKKMEV
jgi:hypothetical protein